MKPASWSRSASWFVALPFFCAGSVPEYDSTASRKSAGRSSRGVKSTADGERRLRYCKPREATWTKFFSSEACDAEDDNFGLLFKLTSFDEGYEQHEEEDEEEEEEEVEVPPALSESSNSTRRFRLIPPPPNWKGKLAAITDAAAAIPSPTAYY